MDNGNKLDLDLIRQTCGTGSEVDAEVFIKNLINLADNYTDEELIEIYNYLIKKVHNPKILITLLGLVDKFRSESSVSVLVDLLLLRVDLTKTPFDVDDFVSARVMCAKVLAHIKHSSSIQALLYCLNNKEDDYKVRLACADALGKIGDTYAVTPLIDLMQDDEEKSVYLKESAVSALGLLGDARAIEPLVSILETKQGFLDKFSFLKERVIEALSKLNVFNDKSIMRALKTSLYDSSPIVRIDAIEAIMNSGDEDAVNIILPCLKDDDKEVSKNALVALYNLMGREILDEVVSVSTYGEYIKAEAQNLIDEYESDNEENSDEE